MSTEDAFSLRRSATPYISLGVIFFGIAIWLSILAYPKRDWGTMESALLLLGIYALYVFIGTRYRIFVRANTITQRAFGKRSISIEIKDIESVGTELSDLKTMRQMNRPFRRIAINATRDGRAEVIDVSTKHFSGGDIRKLMRLIHSKRPDLQLPGKWL